MAKVTIIGLQQAKAAMEEALRKFKTTDFITVGIHEDTGNHPDSLLTNAQVGAFNNFGTDKIPARPWLEPGVRSKDDEYNKIITNAAADGQTLKQALERVGPVAQAAVQVYMTELKTPPNAASTIAMKGSSNPLIDTGALRQSVNYKVTSTKPTEGL